MATLSTCETKVLEDFDRQRASEAITQEDNNDLPLASFAVAIIAEGAQGVFLAFEIATGDIVEKQTLRRPLVSEKPLFNIGLLVGEPIQIGIESSSFKACNPRISCVACERAKRTADSRDP
jgi:hypothetical protein